MSGVGKHIAPYLVFSLLGLGIYGVHISRLISFDSDLYSHIPMIFLVTAFLIFNDRREIFRYLNYSLLPGSFVSILGIAVYGYALANQSGFSQNDYASLLALGLAVYLVGGFLCFLGFEALKKAAFPLFMLVFTIPIPDLLLKKITLFLQNESFAVSAWILDRLGLFPIREGFILTLPDIKIEVAEQCSGIRSTLVLFILSVLSGYYCLGTYAARAVLVVFSIFWAPLKNGLRIATLTVLSIYWDKRIMQGPLHTSGGIPFFLLSMVFLLLAILVLYKLEKVSMKYLGSKQKRINADS